MSADTRPGDPDAMPGIVFIRLPEGMARPIGSFMVDPDIPIPVETGDPARGLAELGWEMIVAGMLRYLALEPDDRNASYYRRFVLAVKPGIFTELSEAGIIKARNRDLDVAEEIFRALAGLAPEAPEPLLNLAVIAEDRADALERSGREDLAEAERGKAFELYRRLLTMEPPFPDAFFNAGFFFLKNRTYDRARGLFQTYLGIGDDEAKKDKAREIVSRLRDRGDRDTMFKEAYDFIKMGRERDGVARALEFLDKDPAVWNGWFLVGWGRRRLGEYAEAREAFLKALELGADEVDLLNELAICEMESGMLDSARSRLERALRKEPDNLKLISNLGVVARRQGRVGDAIGFFRTVLDAEPDDPLALRQLAELEGA